MLELDAITTLMQQGAFEEADDRLRPLMRWQPNNAEAFILYAINCAKQLRYDSAVEACFHVLHGEISEMWTRINATRVLSNALCALDLKSLAYPYIASLGVGSSPFPSDRCWEGRMFHALAEDEQALRIFDRIIADLGPNVVTQYFQGESLLSLGISEGYMDDIVFSTREFWKLMFSSETRIPKMWEGERLEGKSIAVIPHGGFGDYFQFLRHVPYLKKIGAEVVTAITMPNIAGIVESVVDIRPWDQMEALKASSDYWVQTFGLERLRLFGAPQAPRKPYLRAPACPDIDLLAQDIRRQAKGRPCLGLYWHSDADGGETKSVPLHNILPLLARKDIHWVIFQRGYGLRRLRSAGFDANVTVLNENLTFDQVGALMPRLDAMVSICAWSFHLAAALGVKTWLLAGRLLAPRHENRERDSVLYPGVATLARQPRCGDWRGAIQILTADIDDWLCQRSNASSAGELLPLSRAV
jgi:hypothetical protein